MGCVSRLLALKSLCLLLYTRCSSDQGLSPLRTLRRCDTASHCALVGSRHSQHLLPIPDSTSLCQCCDVLDIAPCGLPPFQPPQLSCHRCRFGFPYNFAQLRLKSLDLSRVEIKLCTYPLSDLDQISVPGFSHWC